MTQMLYRSGKTLKWAGHDLDCLVVDGDEEEAAARADGWVSPHEIVDPLDHDGDGKKGGSRPRKRKTD